MRKGVRSVLSSHSSILEGGSSSILDLPPLALWEAERKDEGRGKGSHTGFHLVAIVSLVFIFSGPCIPGI